MKQEIDVFNYASRINEAMKKGILITTKAGDKVNTMTIGWGTMGIEWGKPIFVAYVRESRYTRELLDESGEFTINVPLDDSMTESLIFCGRNSGRDLDKIQKMGFTLEDSISVAAPGIRELPLTLECKVRFRQLQDVAGSQEETVNRYYPGVQPDGTPDRHIAYYGEILNSYIIRN